MVDEYKDCPYCGDENLAGARACPCGYRFEGYKERELAVMEAAAEVKQQESRTSLLVGGGLIAAGVG